MNIVQLEAAFSKDPDPSSTVLRGLARANGVGIQEVEQWFKERRDALEVQAEHPEIEDRNVPGPSEASKHQDQDQSGPKSSILDVNEEVPGNQSAKRIRETSSHQDRNESPPAKRPAALNPAIREINLQIDLYLHSPKHRDFFLGILKTMGPGITEEEIDGVGQVIGVNPSIIRHWKQVLESQGLLSIAPPKIDRSQVAPPPRPRPRSPTPPPYSQDPLSTLVPNPANRDSYLRTVASARQILELYAQRGIPPYMEDAIAVFRHHIAAVDALQPVEPPKPTTPVKLTRQEAAERFRKMAEEFRANGNVKQEEADSQ